MAKEFINHNISFAIANEEDFLTDIKILGLEDWGEDISVGIFAPHNVRYAMKEELDPDNLWEFVDAFLNDKLEPYVRSEPVPRKVKNAAIQQVVGLTFTKFMSNPSASCLIKLCMNEAHKCADAEKHFQALVVRYEGSEEVVFGEMNMALNDVPVGTVLEGELPIYLFHSKGSKDFVPVSPVPVDENDLIFFLKNVHHIRPTVTPREVRQREQKKQQKKKNNKENRNTNKKEEL